MVSALITLDDDTNKAITVIKAREGLKDKGEAISFIVKKYFQNQEPELLPEFVEKLKLIEKQTPVLVEDFGRRFIHSKNNARSNKDF